MPEDDRSGPGGADERAAEGAGGAKPAPKAGNLPDYKDFASKRKRAAQRERPGVNMKKLLVWGSVVAVILVLIVLAFLL